jgi:hypothetical protein
MTQFAKPSGTEDGWTLDRVSRKKISILSACRACSHSSTSPALTQLSEPCSVDGDMEYLRQVSNLAETAWLKGLGATQRTDSVRLTVQAPGQPARPVVLATRDSARAGRQDRLVAPPGGVAPLFLSNLSKTFWHTPVPEHDALYVQVNNLVNAQDETLAAYGRRLWGVLDTTSARNLWQLSTPGDRRREISPEVPVQLTGRAYFAGQDPALDAIYRIIDSRRAAAAQQPAGR